MCSTKSLQSELAIYPLAVYDRLEFNRAFQKLKGLYTRKGFFEAKILYGVEQDPITNEIDITISIEEGRHGRIRNIDFKGFTYEEERYVLDTMSTKLFNMITGWVTGEGVYNEDMVRQDEFIIMDYLRNKGYADAQVSIQVEQIGNNQLGLLILADKGPLYHIGSISFEGNGVLDDACLYQHLLFQEGEIFSSDSLRQSLQNIRNAYGRIGYIDAFVNFDTCLIPGTNTYNIHFSIEESQCYRVGLIQVFGNYNTHTRIILLEALLTPGEVFNADKLQRTETRLLNIGYFKNVNVYAVKTGDSALFGPEYRDVYIEVEETGTGNFSLSAGLSNIENLFGVLEITERNFNICGFRALQKYGVCALRGAGEFLKLNATIGMKNSSYSAQWVKPFIYDTPWTIGFNVAQETTRYVSSDYYFRTLGASFNASYRLNAFMQIAYYYRMKYSYTKRTGKPDDDDDDSEDPKENALTSVVRQATQDMRDEGNRLLQEQNAGGKGPYEKETGIRGLVSAAGVRLLYDTRDNAYNPLCGWASTFQAEFAGVGGPFRFLTFSYLNAYYYPIRQCGVIRLRGDMKFIQPWGQQRYQGIPLDERLFLGDEFFVRGYRPYKIGPVFPDKPNAPRGGLSLQFLSAEYTHFFTPNVEGFLFFDGGALNRSEWDFFTGMRFSAGFGSRFQLISSLPPITMGIGYPINPKNRREVKRFFISVGGQF